ncbi:MAG: aminotransferase family protein [Clostridia bacterium]
MYTKKEASDVWNGFKQMKTYLEHNLYIFEKGSGIYLIDQGGKKYIDGISNMLSANLGHNNSHISERIISQMTKLDSCSLMYATSHASIEYSEKLLMMFKGHFKHIFYTNSGSEAADTAIKIAKQYFYNIDNSALKSKTKIITLKGAYHGSTIAAVNVTGNEHDIRALGEKMATFRQVVPPNTLYRPEGIIQQEWDKACLKKMEESIIGEGPETIAAIMVELVQLSNGVAVFDKEYFIGIKELCCKYNILWIVDEVATGFGRTGKMFACEGLGVWPDIMMLAKGITNGVVPLGAVLVTSRIFDAFYGDIDSKKELSNGFTSSGHPLACSAAIATLEVMEKENILDKVQANEASFITKMKGLEDFSFVKSVQGVGYMAGIMFEDVKLTTFSEWEIGGVFEGIFKKKGLLTYYEGNGKMFIAPPLIAEAAEIRKIVDVIYDSFGAIDKALSRIQ